MRYSIEIPLTVRLHVGDMPPSVSTKDHSLIFEVEAESAREAVILLNRKLLDEHWNTSPLVIAKENTVGDKHD